MKKLLFAFGAMLLLGAAVSAQSTVDSIAAKYKLLPMPDPMTIEKTFPVLGSYQLNATADGATNLTVTLDSVNRGIVWVEGLPQGRIKAYLRKSPATYRIMAQKTETGKQVPEGTLYLDTATNNISIALGKAYDDADPLAVFALNPAATDAGLGVNSEVTVKTDDGKVKTEVENDGTVKTKTKTATSKSKSKVTFYTGTKIVQNTNATQPQQQPQQQQ